MTDKSIDISEEVYNKIKNLKHKEESVSDFLHRILNKNNLDSNRELEDISEDWEKIEKYLYEDRLKGKTREIEL
jgi:predicted CopG family antitoxin